MSGLRPNGAWYGFCRACGAMRGIVHERGGTAAFKCGHAAPSGTFGRQYWRDVLELGEASRAQQLDRFAGRFDTTEYELLGIGTWTCPICGPAGGSVRRTVAFRDGTVKLSCPAGHVVDERLLAGELPPSMAAEQPGAPPPARRAAIDTWADAFDAELQHPRALLHRHGFQASYVFPTAKSCLWNGRELECQQVDRGEWRTLKLPLGALRDLFVDHCEYLLDDGLVQEGARLPPYEIDRLICHVALVACGRQGSLSLRRPPHEHRFQVCRSFDTWHGRWQHASFLTTRDFVPCTGCRRGATPRGDGSQLVAAFRMFENGRPQLYRCRDCAEPEAPTVEWTKSPIPGHRISTNLRVDNSFRERDDAPTDMHQMIEGIRRGIDLIDRTCLTCERSIGGVYFAALRRAGYRVPPQVQRLFYVREIEEASGP